MKIQTEHPVLAAVDLGSNSFHMIIAQVRDGHFQVMDRLREMVQLRAGLDNRNRLTESAQQNAIACLQRFGERVKDLPEGSVRVVGTNTLRVAKNSHTFLTAARQALGHPIEIVSGEEEARLIYLGVAHNLAFDSRRRLVIDIGGGSTEYIIGEAVKSIDRESLSMGCVSYSQLFFPDGEISAKRMKMALIMAGRQLRAIQRPYRNAGWVEAVGASGTIRSIANIVKENGWADDGSITADSLEKLLDVVTAVDHVSKLKIAGLTEERASILPSGLALLKASFERLEIERMIVSDGALREGLLYDLLGRIEHDDERERTIVALARRYHVDEKQAQQVETMVEQFFDQVSKQWGLNESHRDQLRWAAQLHEIGLSISHHQFHKHAYYLAAHSIMPGFSREEQSILALLVLGQRKSFPKKKLKTLPKELRKATYYLIVLLRLAMVFNRGRSEVTDTYVSLSVAKNDIALRLPAGWLAQHPLTEADLQQEVTYLRKAKFNLEIS